MAPAVVLGTISLCPRLVLDSAADERAMTAAVPTRGMQERHSIFPDATPHPLLLLLLLLLLWW
jgi:hypothetical protein